MPDLNSLPPSNTRSTPSSPPIPRTMSSSAADATTAAGQASSPRSTSTSLFAAAAVNAGLQHEDTRRSSITSSRTRPPSQSGRRRSTVLMNLQLNDPSLPGPGEMINEAPSYRTASPHSVTASPVIATGDPHHNRAPSLGEIHQELEQEQEAQVNRLLQMIRTQQQQLSQLQAAAGQPQIATPAIDDSTPTSERSMSFSIPNPPHTPSVLATPRSPRHPRSSFDLARADIQRRSRTPSRAASQTASPRLRSTSISGEAGENWSLGGRDESAFYQAETQMMTRENQMLRQRIRELERQVNELHANAATTHEPATHSHLTHSQSVSEEPSSANAPVPSSIRATPTEELKEE
ncbi:hypothetical protein PVAG01_09996 [Phlyctema vagabunda]|uniref:Uncharacterized protein n=1 Tax=Phlyctema vagabunda TaxID=108571 RepID=A0ABR4P4N3_9HELO